jgi:hypothetical protein
MSAFIVSEACMHKVVSALHDERASCEDCDRLGRELYAMNARAVAARYRDRVVVGDGSTYRYSPRVPTPIEALKALECLRCQCTEGDMDRETLYSRLTDRINDLRADIVRELPEYSVAPWDNDNGG